MKVRLKTKETWKKIRLEKAKKTLECVENAGLKFEEIKRMIENNHSAGMIVDRLKRDYWNDELSILKLDAVKLTKMCHQFEVRFDNKSYLCSPQWWKLQYRFPSDCTPAQIQKICYEKSKQGAISLSQQRKKWDKYTPKNHVEYWLESSSSLEDATIKCLEYRRSRSPYCVAFYTKKGSSIEEAKEKIANLAISRCHKSLKSSKTTKPVRVVCDVLAKLRIEFVREFCLTRENGKRYFYDFYLPKLNLLIEVNGTFWHADPRIFAENQIMKFPSGQILASEKWKMDLIKLSNAEKAGYRVLTVWEIDAHPEYVELLLRREGFLSK